MTGKKFSKNRVKSTANRLSVRMHSPWRHDFLLVLSKNGWIFLVGLVLFLLLIPFSTAGLPGSSIFNIEVTHDQMKFRLIHEQALTGTIAAAVGMGLLAGISLFRFVQDKKETTIFFSMGITRTTLFANRMIAGILILAGSIGIPMALSFWLNLQALGDYEGLGRNSIYLTTGIFTVAYISFVIAALVSFVAGTLMETLVYWTIVICAPAIVCYSSNLLLKQLCWGNAWGEILYSGVSEVQPSLLEHFSSWNPLLFFLEELEKHARFVRPLSTSMPEAISPGRLIGWLAAGFVLTVLAWYLLKWRKAEIAGISGMNRVLPEIVIALSGFLVFSVVFFFLCSFSFMMASVLGAVSFLGVHLFWRKILFSQGFGWKKGLISVFFQSAVLWLVCGLFSGNFLHGDRRFLKNAEIQKAEVTYVGAPEFFCGEISGSSTGRGYYIMSQLTLEQPESIEKVKSLQELFIESGKMDMKSSAEVSDTVIPYDICFSYTDTEGEKHVWYYDRASYGQLEQMLALEEMSDVKEKQQQLFEADSEESSFVWAKKAYRTGDVYLSDTCFSKTYQLTLDEEQRSALLHEIWEDISSMTLEERYFPEKSACAVLMFSQNGEYDCKYYAYHLDNSFVYLTPDYVHTLSWLEENQLLFLIDGKPEVECIYLQKFDPYIGINGMSYPMGMYFMSYCADTPDEFLIQKDFGKKYSITEEEKIREILPGLQNGYFMSKGGFLAAVKLKGEERYRYLFLPQESVPDFIRG